MTDDMFDDPTKVLTAGISHTDLQAVKRASVFPTVLSWSNLNLTGSQKELLLWHQRLGLASLQLYSRCYLNLEPKWDNKSCSLEIQEPQVASFLDAKLVNMLNKNARNLLPNMSNRTKKQKEEQRKEY
jgi:hypothetical protein